MSLRGMDDRLVATGHWARCLFCRRVLPTRAWTQDACWAGGRDSEAVEANGYCTSCQPYATAGKEQRERGDS